VAQLRALSDNTADEDFEGIVTVLLGTSFSDRSDRSITLAPLLFRRGVAFASAMKWTESLNSFNLSAKLGFNATELFEKRGLTLLKLESWDRAETDYQELRRRSSNNVPLPAAFAILFYRKTHQALLDQKWTEAIDRADDALRLDPRHALTFHDRGLARFNSTRQAKAVLEDELKPALSYDSALIPDAAYRTVVLQYARDQDDKYWKASDTTARGLICRETLGLLDVFLPRLAPKDPDLLMERGGMRRRTGELAKALEDARTAHRERPDGASALFLGQIEYLLSLQVNPSPTALQSALEHLSDAQRSSPKDYKPLFWRGLCHLAIAPDNPENALQDLSEARKLNPNSPFLALQLSTVRLKTMVPKNTSEGSKEAAEEAFLMLSSQDLLSEEDFVAAGYGSEPLDKAKILKAWIRDARLNRAKAFFYASLYTTSVQESTAALQSDESSVDAYYWRGKARYAAHEYRTAGDDFKSALRHTTNPGDRKNLESWISRCEQENK
jgi:tetratricopeptide (TPR) repeat protein